METSLRLFHSESACHKEPLHWTLEQGISTTFGSFGKAQGETQPGSVSEATSPDRGRLMLLEAMQGGSHFVMNRLDMSRCLL